MATGPGKVEVSSTLLGWRKSEVPVRSLRFDARQAPHGLIARYESDPYVRACACTEPTSKDGRMAALMKTMMMEGMTVQ